MGSNIIPPGMSKLMIPYVPHEKQKLFHDSTARIRAIVSGIRGGKTFAGTMESIKVSINGRGNFKAPNVGCVIAPTYPMLRDIILPIFNQKCPDVLIEQFHHTDMVCQFKNGSKILFRSAEDPNKLRGLDLHWFWLDEPRDMKADIYDVILGRIAQKAGCGWLTTTTKGFDWVHGKILKPFWDQTDPDIEVIQFTSYQNPHFPKEEIERLKKQYTEDFFNQEIMAQVVKIEGLVYKEFSRFEHVKEMDIGRIKYSVIGVDFGFANPAAVYPVCFMNDGEIYIPEEFFQTGMLTKDLAVVIKKFTEKYKGEATYCDPSEPGCIEELRLSGINAVKGNNQVFAGMNKVNEYIRPRKLFVNPSCINLIREFESYYIRPGTDAPVKIDDHALDAVRYAVFTEVPKAESTDYVVSW